MSTLRCELCAIQLDTGHNIGDFVVTFQDYWLCGDCRKRDSRWNREIELRAKHLGRQRNIHWIQCVHPTQRAMIKEHQVDESELWD